MKERIERSFNRIEKEKDAGYRRDLVRCLSGQLFNEYLTEAWTGGPGCCGDDWNWNCRLEQIQRWQDRLCRLA
jgi:hypothetical protein